MKYLALILFAGIIFLNYSIFAPSYVGNVSEKNTSIAKTQAVLEKNLASAEQKADSFTAGMAFQKEKRSLDTIEVTVGRGKTYLLTQVDNRLKQLDPFRTRISNTSTLSESDRKILVAELNAEIDRFQAFKPEIKRSVTKQDVRNVADKIKTEWIKSRLTVQRVEGQIQTAEKEKQLISDADADSSGIQKRINALKAAGKSTKDHEKLLAAYREKIAAARQDVRSAKDKFYAAASAPSENEKQNLMKKKDLLLSSASDSIKEAYKMVGQEARREFSQRFK